MSPMTHQDAQADLAVERYLLDELSGEARDRFEEHLFDCTECAADLKAGMLFIHTAKDECRAEAYAAAPARPAEPRPNPISEWFARLFQPLVLAPALAAALCVIAYQSAVLLPRAHTQLAEARTPSVLDTLVLANAGPRGDGSPADVLVSPNGAYLLAVDLPPAPGASAYRCTLHNPSGKAVWHVDIPVQEDRDSITIQVPAAATGPGMNVLSVQAIEAADGGKLMDLVTYRFNLLLKPAK